MSLVVNLYLDSGLAGCIRCRDNHIAGANIELLAHHLAKTLAGFLDSRLDRDAGLFKYDAAVVERGVLVRCRAVGGIIHLVGIGQGVIVEEHLGITRVVVALYCHCRAVILVADGQCSHITRLHFAECGAGTDGLRFLHGDGSAVLFPCATVDRILDGNITLFSTLDAHGDILGRDNLVAVTALSLIAHGKCRSCRLAAHLHRSRPQLKFSCIRRRIGYRITVIIIFRCRRIYQNRARHNYTMHDILCVLVDRFRHPTKVRGYGHAHWFCIIECRYSRILIYSSQHILIAYLSNLRSRNLNQGAGLISQFFAKHHRCRYRDLCLRSIYWFHRRVGVPLNNVKIIVIRSGHGIFTYI